MPSQTGLGSAFSGVGRSMMPSVRIRIDGKVKGKRAGRPLPHELWWCQGTADSSPFSPLIAAAKGSE